MAFRSRTALVDILGLAPQRGRASWCVDVAAAALAPQVQLE